VIDIMILLAQRKMDYVRLAFFGVMDLGKNSKMPNLDDPPDLCAR
jgi:hypothetical protein